MTAMEQAFNLMGKDIVELSAEIELLKKEVAENIESWLEESRPKLLKISMITKELIIL